MTRPPDLPPYPQYKPSGIPWLDDIPAHWEIRRLKYVAEMRLSNVDKHVRENELPVRLCNYVDVYKNDFITQDIAFMRATASQKEIEKFRLKRDDVLITKDSETWDDIGVPALVIEPADDLICGYHLALLRPRDHMLGRYLFRVLQSNIIAHQFCIEAHGVTRYGLTQPAIKSVRLPLPPPDEQAAIARYLDYKDALIQRYLHAKRRLVPLLQQLRKSTIHYAVTRGLDPENTPTKPSGIPWLGNIPAHWEMRRLKMVCRLSYGDTLTAEMRLDGPVPVYGSNGQIGVHSSANTNAPCIIVGRKGSFGKVNYSEQPAFAIDTTYFVDERNSNADLRWLYYYLGWLNLDDVSRDSAIPGLNRQEAYQRVGPIPPLDEQAAIAEYLDEKIAVIDAAIVGTSRLIDLVQQYRASLIHHVVTGKRDVRHAAAALPDAPAPDPR